MRAMIAMVLVCVPFVCVPFCATAQNAPGGDRPYVTLGERFERANVTHDGKLTLDQAQHGMPRIAEHFAEIDTAKKGYVTIGQVRDYANAYHRARGDAPLPSRADAATQGTKTAK